MSRSGFLRPASSWFAGGLAFLLASVSAAASDKADPAPNLDRLATRGLRFTDAHGAAATCTPSRYSLPAGEMAFRNPGTGIARGNAKRVIRADQYTLGGLFQQAGYKTAVVGKWHLGLGDGTID